MKIMKFHRKFVSINFSFHNQSINIKCLPDVLKDMIEGSMSQNIYLLLFLYIREIKSFGHFPHVCTFFNVKK